MTHDCALRSCRPLNKHVSCQQRQQSPLHQLAQLECLWTSATIMYVQLPLIMFATPAVEGNCSSAGVAGYQQQATLQEVPVWNLIQIKLHDDISIEAGPACKCSQESLP